MLRSLLIIFYTLTWIECKNETQTQVPKILRKIIGGEDCATEKYPFIVSIRTITRLKHFCGGSLIKPDIVLTAAHCITVKSPSYYTVVVGTSEINQKGVQRRSVKTIFSHKKYSANDYSNDIAIMELKEDIDMNSKLVGLIQLPPTLRQKNVKDHCEEATVIGWGHRESWDPKTSKLKYVFKPVLQCVSIPVLTHNECILLLRKPLLDDIVCAYSPGGSKDACQGDSGGPLFCGNIQYGIVSSGYGCGLPNSPGYYTRVDRHLGFIEDVMSKRSNSERSIIYSNKGNNIPPQSPIAIWCYTLLVLNSLLVLTKNLLEE